MQNNGLIGPQLIISKHMLVLLHTLHKNLKYKKNHSIRSMESRVLRTCFVIDPKLVRVYIDHRFVKLKNLIAYITCSTIFLHLTSITQETALQVFFEH